MCERDVNFIEVFMRYYYDAGYNFKCKTKSFFLAIITQYLVQVVLLEPNTYNLLSLFSKRNLFAKFEKQVEALQNGKLFYTLLICRASQITKYVSMKE